MTILKDYAAFKGRLADTGPLTNLLEAQGVIAPHSGRALSEDLLFGISGGVIAGYFVFEYEDHDPFLHFVTRSSLQPFQTLLDRLGAGRKALQTDRPDKALENLKSVLADGNPALVWADRISLGYSHALPYVPYYMNPVTVFGVDEDAGIVHLADESSRPLEVALDRFQESRGVIRKEKYRVLRVDGIKLDRLAEAVTAGLRQSAAAMLDEAPLKPMRGKFGLDAFTRWADALSTPGKTGWGVQFAPGRRMFSGLLTGYFYLNIWYTGGRDSRGAFARCLEEAASLLNNPALTEVAGYYHRLSDQWRELRTSLLPDSLEPLGQIRALLDRRQALFIAEGQASHAERGAISAEIEARCEAARRDFPLDEAGAAAFREALREKLLALREGEKEAALALRAGIGQP